MRSVACALIAATALAVAVADAVSADCDKDCGDRVARPYHHGVRHYVEGYRHHYKPYRYDPDKYIPYRAYFGYGGCRTAYLPYEWTWQLASNC